MTWRRLSQRDGTDEPEELLEGIPPHLRYPLEQWIKRQFGWFRSSHDGGMKETLMASVASTLRIAVKDSYEPGGISDQIFRSIDADDELYLDCIDLLLHLGSNPGQLRSDLITGGSAWTVSSDGKSLERRVDQSSADAMRLATSSRDSVSAELELAWSLTYGRAPDPSDAWDHAIKAVEELLIPIVVANKPKATLGDVAGELKSNPSRYGFGLQANGVLDQGQTLEALVRLIWPNPDRHGAGSKRLPTQNEAEQVTQTAVYIVTLCRGRLVRT